MLLDHIDIQLARRLLFVENFHSQSKQWYIQILQMCKYESPHVRTITNTRVCCPSTNT